MARSRAQQHKRKSRALNTLKEKGLLACVIGAGMLLVPIFAGKSPPMAGLATALRPAGWVALGIGIVFLGLHYLVKTKQSKSEEQPDAGVRIGNATRRNRKAKTAETERTEPQWSGNAGTPAASAEHTAAAPNLTASHIPATAWSTEVFGAIEWRRFEAVCEALFAQAGFKTHALPHGTDGGVDIWLHSGNTTSAAPVAVVQCKHWQGKPVGVKEIREFFGVMASHQLKRGTYATTSCYTPDPRQFAKANGINALDGAGLLKVIAARTPEQQKDLLDVAFEGEYWRPTCARCGVKMVERTPSKGGAHFWGCSGYPRCQSRLPMVAALR